MNFYNIVLLADEDSKNIEMLKEITEDQIAVFNDLHSIIEPLLENKIELLIVENSHFKDYETLSKETLYHLKHLNTSTILLGELSDVEELDNLVEHHVVDVIEPPFKYERLAFAIKNAKNIMSLKKRMHYSEKEVNVYQSTINTLNQIGISLSTEKDLDSLLNLILIKVRQLTNSDSGSFYIIDDSSITEADRKMAVEGDGACNKNLIFKVLQNDSIHFDFEESTLPINRRSLAGYVAIEGKPLNIADAYKIDPDAEYAFNRSFDEKSGYLTRSMLILPLKNHKSEVIGVIALINRKKDRFIILDDEESVNRYVLPYEKEIVDFATSIASQAAVALENVQLLQNIQDLFDSFVYASVTAIEQRDPTTSGHSERVATMSVAIAQEINHTDQGLFNKTIFSKDQIREIKYAALLHDFGKVGVREKVLVKESKLFDWDIRTLEERFGFLKSHTKMMISQEKIDFMQNNPNSKWDDKIAELDRKLHQQLKRYDDYFNFIRNKNKPSYMSQEDLNLLEEIMNLPFVDYYGEERKFLTSSEKQNLSIGRGTLNEEERHEIESHVTHTYNFLSKIPWLENLKMIPEIAYCHHEKLDGTGYPRGISSDKIPIQSQILAIADIFDALTATDRPYKLSIPLDKALQILKLEVEDFHINRDIVDLFTKKRLYRTIGINR